LLLLLLLLMMMMMMMNHGFAMSTSVFKQQRLIERWL